MHSTLSGRRTWSVNSKFLVTSNEGLGTFELIARSSMECMLHQGAEHGHVKHFAEDVQKEKWTPSSQSCALEFGPYDSWNSWHAECRAEIVFVILCSFPGKRHQVQYVLTSRAGDACSFRTCQCIDRLQSNMLQVFWPHARCTSWIVVELHYILKTNKIQSRTNPSNHNVYHKRTKNRMAATWSVIMSNLSPFHGWVRQSDGMTGLFFASLLLRVCLTGSWCQAYNGSCIGQRHQFIKKAGSHSQNPLQQIQPHDNRFW